MGKRKGVPSPSHAVRACVATNLRRLVSTPRVYAVLILSALFVENQFAPIRQMLVAENLRIGFSGMLLYFLNDVNFTMIMGLGLLMLVFDTPSNDPTLRYVVARTGKRAFERAQVLYLLQVTFFYLLAIALIFLCIAFPWLDFSGAWGEGLLAFARDGAYETYNSMLNYDPWLLTAYTPASGLALVAALHFLAYASLSLLAYCVNLCTGTHLGFCLAALPLAFDGVVEEFFYENMYYYSPVTLCRLSALDYGDDMGRPALWYAFLLLTVLCLLFAAVSGKLSRKKEIRL